MFGIMLEIDKNVGRAVKAAMKVYSDAKGRGITQGDLAAVVAREVRAWKPKVKGTEILTPAVRAALARAVGGLAYNIAAAQAGRELV